MRHFNKNIFATLICLGVMHSSVGNTQTLVINSNDAGTQDGFYYSFWKTNGDAFMRIVGEGHYQTTWNESAQQWMGGMGIDSGSTDAVIHYSGSFDVDEGGSGFLGLYSSSTAVADIHERDEFYIIESYSAYDPSSCSGALELGNYPSDGATYVLRKCVRQVLGDPVTRVNEYYAIRQPIKPVGILEGTITATNHFNALAAQGVNISSIAHSILATEGYLSRGSADIHVSVENEAPVISANASGEHNGFFYSLWKDSGDVRLQLLDSGHFLADWTSSTNNFVGGIGLKSGAADKYVRYSANLAVEQSQNVYFGLYMLSSARKQDDIYEEYYIVESLGAYDPTTCVEGAQVGEYEVDGAVYRLKRCDRYINGIARSTHIKMYFAVRAPLKGFGEISGEIPVIKHMNHWAALGVEPVSPDYMILAVEGYQSSGSADIRVEISDSALGKLITNSERGMHNDLYYVLSKGNGDATLELFDKGHYQSRWTDSIDWYGGLGWKTPPVDEVIKYNASLAIENANDVSFGLFGEGPQFEFHVLESYSHFDPSECVGESYGSYESDGAIYTPYVCPFVLPDVWGTSYPRYFSVREESKGVGNIRGQISLANHLAAWESIGVSIETRLDYLILATKSYQSAGSSDVTIETEESPQVLTSISDGTYDDLYYYFWKDSGDASMWIGADGHYTSQWDETTNNWMGGYGWTTDIESKIVNYSGQFTIDETQNGYLSFYGWTTDPLIELYIVESYGSYNPANCSAHRVDYGTFESDGAIYAVSSCRKYGMEGVAPRDLYFSVRTPKLAPGEVQGTITVANHLNQWRAAGLELGTFEYMILATEGYQSRGSSNIVVTEGIVSSSSSSSRSSHSSVVSESSSSFQSSSSSDSACIEMCRWYDDALRPLCTQSDEGWGWENNASCIGRYTCAEQYGDGGVEAVCQ